VRRLCRGLQTFPSGHRIAEDDRPAEDACVIESLMTEELTRKIVAWATEIASCAAGLPSNRARDAYLAERRRRAHTKPRLERCVDGTGEKR
jgi:hypothetical protein